MRYMVWTSSTMRASLWHSRWRIGLDLAGRTERADAVVGAIPVDVVEAHTTEYLHEVRGIFVEYAEWLGFDLCFQHFDEELAHLPGDYAPPAGRLLLAVEAGRTAGCVALRPFTPGICEMKRMYVRPAFRGRGVGRLLAKRIIDEARTIGYERMRLDTVPSMTTAIHMYESLGFRDVPPYRHNPIDGARYMELVLIAPTG